jgi:hypothetical protein
MKITFAGRSPKKLCASSALQKRQNWRYPVRAEKALPGMEMKVPS